MPDGGRGWYTNAVEGYAHEDDLIKDVVGLGRADLPGQGRAIGPGDRRALDGRLRRGQARPEASRDVRQRQFPFRGPRRSSGSTSRSPQGPQPRIRADLRREGRPAAPRTPSRSSRSSTTAGFPRSGSIAGPRISSSTRTAPSMPTSKGDEDPARVPGVPRQRTTGPTGTSTSGKPSRSTSRTYSWSATRRRREGRPLGSRPGPEDDEPCSANSRSRTSP